MAEERLKVLLADDEYWIRENLRTIIDWSAFGLELLPMAVDGEDALAKMEAESAHIVITDIDMPYVSGVELMQQIRERWPQTVILVLSGYSDFEYVHQALLAGALDYILKPINRNKLVEILQRAMEQVFAYTRERREQEESQTRLKLAASMVQDRDFSQWLHDAKRQGQMQNVEAQLFDYEASFSSYRVVLVKLPGFMRRLSKGSLPSSAAEAVYAIKTVLGGLSDEENKLLVHDLYHASHFLLVTEMDEAALRQRLPQKLHELYRLAQTPPRAMVSASYFSLRDLHRAYDDVQRALMEMPCGLSEAMGFAKETQKRPLQQRMSAEMQRRLEHAAGAQQRERFERLLEGMGLYRCAQDGWTVIELLHCVNRVAWILRHMAEEAMNPGQLMAMDNLLDLLLDCVDRLDLDELRSLLTQLMDEFFIPVEVSGQSDTMHGIVTRVKEYIDAHYSQAISLSGLAARFNVGDSYLSRSFKQQVGTNLMLYLANTRIAQARKLLKDRSLSITDVAQLVGYDDYAYFSRVFKKTEGKSPRAYREEEAGG